MSINNQNLNSIINHLKSYENSQLMVVTKNQSAKDVKDFVLLCFKKLGLKYNNHVRIDKKLLRPSKTSSLLGNIGKAKKQLKFNPKVNLKKLIDIMIQNELKKYD